MIRNLSVVLLVGLFAMPAVADIVVLTNGDRLTGEVVEQTSEEVTLNHPGLGPIVVPMNQVQAITANENTATSDAPGGDAAAPPPAETAPAPSEPEAEPAPDVKAGLFGTSFLQGWDKSIELSISGSEGNTEEMNFRLAANGEYEDDEDRWLFDSAWFYSTSNSVKTKNNVTAGLTKDWLFQGSDWFAFALGRYDYDEFQDYLHRVSAGGGAGYQFVKNDEWDVLGRIGLNATKEFDGPNPEADVVPEGLLGVEAAWQINKQQSLSGSNFLYPSIGDFGEFRNVTKIEWRIKLEQMDGLSLKAGIENEYQTDVTSPTKRNDLKYFAGLVYDF